MTEPSRKVLISCGVGSSLRIASRAASWLSSTMMSLHRSMHSSQIKTEGPAMSFRTSCWLLLQNEQCNTLSSADPFFSGIKLFRSEEHTSELQSLMRISYAVFCLKKKNYKSLKK